MGSCMRRLQVLHSRRRVTFLVVLACTAAKQENKECCERRVHGLCTLGSHYLLVEHGLGLAAKALLLVTVPPGTLGVLGCLAGLVLGHLVLAMLAALLALAERFAGLGDVHLEVRGEGGGVERGGWRVEEDGCMCATTHMHEQHHHIDIDKTSAMQTNKAQRTQIGWVNAMCVCMHVITILTVLRSLFPWLGIA